MPVRFYFDDDIGSRAILRELRARGFDAVSSFEAGMYGRADEDHLQYAAAEARVLCTANRGDFMRLHAAYMRAGKHHAGIVLIAQQRYPVGEQLRRIMNLATQLSADEMIDRAEYLVVWGA